MKKAIYLACFLALISALAAGALSYFNELTAPIIKEMAIAAEKENLIKFYPDGEFTAIEDFKDDSGLIKGVYEVKDQGYIYKAEVIGYNASTPIVFMIAFDNDAKIVGYTVLSHLETSGIGSRIVEDEFKNIIVGKTSSDPIATLSGATVSSNAVVKGINAAKAIFNSMKGIEGGDPNEVAPPAAPSLTLGNPTALNNEEGITRYKPTVVSETANGDTTTYVIEINGYGMLEGDSSHFDYSKNQYEVIIDTANSKVVSVKYVVFGDTAGFGDKTDTEEYFNLFKDLPTEDQSATIDVVTGATFTSKSMIYAVNAAIDASKK